MLTRDDQASAKAEADAGCHGSSGGGSGHDGGGSEQLDKLGELVQLYKDGYLTEAEFTRSKELLLGS